MKDNISRKYVLKLAFPLFFASMSDVVMTAVDTMFVGKLGVPEIAAVGLSGIFIWASYNFFKGIPLCVGTFVSQNYGAKRYSKTIESLYNGLLIATISAIILFFYRYLVPYLVLLMKPSENVQNIAIPYIQIRMLGAVGFLSNIAFASFYKGIGKTSVIFKLNLLINIANIILDYFLIFGFNSFAGWGVKGAAIATVISQLGGLAIYSLHFYTFRLNQFRNISKKIRFNYAELKKLLHIGIPKNLFIFSITFSLFIFLVWIGRLGNTQLAATTIMFQLVLLSTISATGLGGAGSIYIGQYLGAQRSHSAFKSGYYAIEINLIMTLIFCVAIILAPSKICSLFNSNHDVIMYFNKILYLGILFIIFDNIQMVISQCLSGAGDTKIPFYAMLINAYLIFIPLTYLLTFKMGLGLSGAWLSNAIFMGLYATFTIYRYASKKWLKIDLFNYGNNSREASA